LGSSYKGLEKYAMVTANENIDMLTNTVLSDARAQTEKILAEARAKAETVRQNYRQQAEAERTKILEQARQNAERQQRESVATAQLRGRTQQLADREKQLDKVFQAAGQQLAGMVKGAEFAQISRQLLREALVHLGAPAAKVSMDSTTRQSITDDVLAEISKEVNVEVNLGEPLENSVGIIAESPDGRLRYENTLETRLSRMQNSLRTPVYHLLMGETKI
jgi:V/A-type H+/Na+-transporting ATPase subunit E